MDLDLTFNGFTFGRIHLPSVSTSFFGTKVTIPRQTIQIADAAIYRSFIRSVIVDSETCFQLENGTCTIKALGITAHCDYCLEIPVVDMMGPKMLAKKLRQDGDGHVNVVVDVQNPGPVEISYGWSLWELRNARGETVADLEGDFESKRGWFELILAGKLRDGAAFTTMGSRDWSQEVLRGIPGAIIPYSSFIQASSSSLVTSKVSRTSLDSDGRLYIPGPVSESGIEPGVRGSLLYINTSVTFLPITLFRTSGVSVGLNTSDVGRQTLLDHV